MARPSLLLDEDVRLGLAEILRERGYDVVHVLEERDRRAEVMRISSRTR
jgi:hypothetical protein